jgi:uncharacterized membrane protein
MDVGTVLLLAATAGTGLVAGLFVCFSVAVMPGLRRVDDEAFLSSMQRINVAIVNPLFLLLFLGSPVLLVAAAVVGPRDTWLLAASALHLLALLVTFAVNIPLNNRLDAATDPAPARTAFEPPWTRAHTVRTLLMAVSFVGCLVALAG